MRIRIALASGVLLAVCLLTIPVSAHANLVRAEPGIGASVPTAPTTVRLYFSEAPEPRYSEIMVLNAARARFDTGGIRVVPDDRDSLIVAVQSLPQGIYTVVWKTTSAVDGHTTGGSFAFAVGSASLTSAGTAISTVTFSKPSPLEVATKWLAYLSISVILGAIALGLFIWTPAIAATALGPERDGALAAGVNRRLGTLAESALFVLIAATTVGVLIQVAKATGRSLVGALDLGTLHDYLFETRTGSIWCVRLLLTFVAALALGPRSLRIVRAPQWRETPLRTLAALLGAAVGANELLAISLVSHSAATAFATPVTVALDWLHLLATAIWIGGLVGLVATIPLASRQTSAGRAVLRSVAGRFSLVASVCVGVLVLTGLYSAWVHVGTLGAFTTTDYGRILLIKIALVLGIIALGAINLLWIRPRLSPRTATSGASAMGWHFLRIVSAEVAIGTLILLVVGVLTGLAPSREAVAQTNGSPLAQRTKAGDLSATLTPSTLQPGPITYDLFIDKHGAIRDAEKVALRFASPDLGVDETEAVATTQGDGHYTVTGSYTALVGRWQVRAIVRRTGKDDVTATFTLPIGSVPPSTTPATTPTVTAAVIAYGIIAVIAVISALAGAALLARRFRLHRPYPSHRISGPPAPTPMADRRAD